MAQVVARTQMRTAGLAQQANRQIRKSHLQLKWAPSLPADRVGHHVGKDEVGEEARDTAPCDPDHKHQDEQRFEPALSRGDRTVNEHD
jgi:hypothetical protein